jgi:translation initiation factor IF-3
LKEKARDPLFTRCKSTLVKKLILVVKKFLKWTHVHFFDYVKEVFYIAKQNNEVLINEQITIPEVMVIGPNGEKMGIKKIEDAQTLAKFANLDLVLLNNDPKNPVCKIIDYNKYRYEKQKQIKEAKKRQREQNLEVKEYRLGVTIDIGDFETKVRNARAYLEKGHKIKGTVRFKGRQLSHPELGSDVLMRFAAKLEDVAEIESMPKMEGRNMQLLLTPKK